MYLLGLSRRRFENWLLVIGQLVLIGYLFQVAAVDHWALGSGHVMSPEEVASHATHCHGAPSGCADSGAITPMASSDQTLKLPSQSAPHGFATDLRMSPAYDAYVEPMSRPPKAA